MRKQYGLHNLIMIFTGWRCGISLGLSVFFLSSTAWGFNTVKYNRSGNMLEGSLTPGQPFLMKGDIAKTERTVRVYYALSQGVQCPKLDLTKVQCPASEQGKNWACQEWRRTISTKDAAEFRVLIPRLRWAFSRYCFQVAYFQSLDNRLVQRLVKKLLKQVRQAISQQWEAIKLPPKASVEAVKQARQRRLNLLRGIAPQPSNLKKLQALTTKIVDESIRADFGRFVGNIDSPTQRKGFRKFLYDEMYLYAKAYLHSQSTRRQFYYLSRYVLLHPKLMVLLQQFVTQLEQSTVPKIQAYLNGRPSRGRESSVKSAIRLRMNKYLNRNVTLFQDLLTKQPTFARRWTRLLRQACQLVRREHNKALKPSGFTNWRRNMIRHRDRPRGPKKAPPASGSPLAALSCYQMSQALIKDIVTPGQKINVSVVQRGRRLLFFIRPNRRMNLYDYIGALHRSAEVNENRLFYSSQLSTTRKKVLDSIGDYLALVTLQRSNISVSITMGARRYVDYFLSTDIGLAGVLLPGFNGLQFTVVPYIGVHLYFKPVLNTIPLSSEDGFLRRFSFFAGITIFPFQLQNEAVNAVGLLGSLSPLAGFGIRITDFIRFSAGAILYRNKSLHPFLEDLEGTVAVTGFVSLSIDLNVIQLVSGSVRGGRVAVRSGQ